MATESNIMEVLARKASSKGGFVGAAMQAITAASNATLSDVASRIQCPVENLVRLSLCKMPRESAAHFASDVTKISEFVDCNPGELANLMREYSAIAAMREFNPDSTSHETMLMAARDKKPELDEDDEADE